MRKSGAVDIIKDESRAQVLLETAIVLISVVVLAIGSMALFSNLKLNLISRQDVYRQSNITAVNSLITESPLGNATNPRTYLEYSPHSGIIVDPVPGMGMGQLYAEEPLLQLADLAFARGDLILNYEFYYKLYRVYQLLGGPNGDNGAILSLPRSSILLARNIAGSLLVDLDKGYGSYADNLAGHNIELTENGEYIFHIPTGGVGMMQYVLDNPTSGGPYDDDLDCNGDPQCENVTQVQNNNNRDALLSSVNRLKNRLLPNLYLSLHGNPPGSIGSLEYNIRYVYNQLNSALSSWFCWGYICPRLNKIRNARNIVVPAVSSSYTEIIENPDGTFTDVPAIFSDSVWANPLSDGALGAVNSLYSGTRDDITYDSAGDLMNYVSVALSYAELSSEHNIARKMLVHIANYLENCRNSWDNQVQRDYYLGYIKMEAKVLYEMVSSTQ